jgi:hypothetical protein
MKSIKLKTTRPTVAELIRSAEHEPVMLETATGQRFLLSPADEFATEVELLRKHHKLLAFLDARGKESPTVPLDKARAIVSGNRTGVKYSAGCR